MNPSDKVKIQITIDTYIIQQMIEGGDYNREENQRNKHIVFIILGYLILTISTHYTMEFSAFDEKVKEQILAGDQTMNFTDVFRLFNSDKFEGQWKRKGSQSNPVLTSETGRFTMSLTHPISPNSPPTSSYELQFNINNGFYTDNGCIRIKTLIRSDEWNIQRNKKSLKVYPKQGTKLLTHYKLDKILKTQDEKMLYLTDFTFTFKKIKKSELAINVKLADTETKTFNINMKVEGRESKLIKAITFAVLLFGISYLEFTAIMEMLRSVIEGRENPSTFSFSTMLFATMWDSVICIVAFVCAFDNEENLILFIMPAFLLCLLFTNLELRLMLLIYQANSENNNIREIICKFNLISYGGLMLIYPILLLTNFNFILFIFISLIFLPQIYNNAVTGSRPDICSPYYSKFLLIRFVLIFYLRAFPYNIFALEPNYLLSFGCAILILAQIYALWFQKIKGPKKCVPNFLLPEVFDYRIDLDPEEGVELTECSICLNLLSMDPANQNDLGYEVQHKLMMTPCHHKYHGLCLVKWMKIKMECPQCRNKLPPFE